MGTVPIGTGLAAMIAWRISSMLPPVLRSMTVSAPYFSANLSFSNSPSTSEGTAEVPMVALILTVATAPLPACSARPPYAGPSVTPTLTRVGKEVNPPRRCAEDGRSATFAEFADGRQGSLWFHRHAHLERCPAVSATD